MASPGIAHLAQFVDEEIVGGVAQDIITVNPFFASVPLMPYTGDGVSVNRELAIGDNQLASVGDTITAVAPSTVTTVTFRAGKIIGASEVDQLVAAEAASDGVAMQALEISSKAKGIARTYQTQMALGDGIAPNLNSLHTLTDASQFTTASAGQALTFALLDELSDLVTAKEGSIDFYIGHASALRQFKALYRALGGTAPSAVVEIPGEQQTRTVLTYEGTPFYRNDYLPIVETANGAAVSGGALMSVYAGCWDDGTRRLGFATIFPAGTPAGIQIVPAFVHPDRDEMVVRVKLYWQPVLFNRRGLARLTSLTQ